MTGLVPLIFLPGALGAFEGADAAVQRLGRNRPVALIEYGPDDTLPKLMAKVAAAAGGAERFDLIGQSYGGWIAQCVARAQAGRVRRLVLSHSFMLEPRHAGRFRFGAWLLRALPRRLVAALLMKRVASALAPVKRRDPARYERLMAALRERAGSEDFLAGLAAQQVCMRQSLEGGAGPLSADLPVLIIESANDPLLREKDRARLRALYPQARVQRFAEAGHVSALIEPDAYAAAVSGFLEE